MRAKILRPQRVACMPEPTAPDAEALAASIRNVAEKAHTEEDVRVGVELLLRPLLSRLGITSSSTPAYERNYRAVLKGEGGQSDAVYGHAIIEYEPPRSLRTARGVKHAQEQLERYLKAEATRSVAKRETSFAGASESAWTGHTFSLSATGAR